MRVNEHTHGGLSTDLFSGSGKPLQNPTLGSMRVRREREREDEERANGGRKTS